MKCISEFRKKKGFNNKLDLSTIKVALGCASKANQLGYDYLANIVPNSNKDSLIIHTHLNLIARIFEQIEGMLTCIVTQSQASAETLARVVEEGSINLMYMAGYGDEKTIAAFMTMWRDGHINKLNSWKDEIKNKDYSEQVTWQIDERINEVNVYSEYIELVKSDLSINNTNLETYWSKSILERFRALDKTDEYYAIYHRLCGSSHLTAEDTILYLIAIKLPMKNRQRIFFQAASYSVMMTRIVILTFVDAVASCSVRHGLKDEDTLNDFKNLKAILEKSIKEISNDAGVPSKTQNQEP
jgi:hypothetical protein